jgi:hypothetical protein
MTNVSVWRNLLSAAGLRTHLNFQPLPTLNAAQEQALSQAVLEAATNWPVCASASRS